MVIIVWLLIYLYIKYKQEQRLNNYDMTKVSMGKMAQDLGTKSTSEIRRNVVNGKYNKDENWKI